jgi:hypothetical protein
MKKTLIACAVLLSAITASFAQGTVNFANTSTTLITTNTPTGSGNMAGLNQYRIGLYVGALGTAESSLSLAGYGTNSPIAGRMNANGAGSFTLPSPGYPTSVQIAFQVRGWSLGSGTSYEEAFAAGALTGTSALGVTTPGGGLVLPGLIFGDGSTDANGNRTVGGFAMTVVPEPSSIALGLLGLGAIALFRRRK